MGPRDAWPSTHVSYRFGYVSTLPRDGVGHDQCGRYRCRQRDGGGPFSADQAGVSESPSMLWWNLCGQNPAVDAVFASSSRLFRPDHDRTPRWPPQGRQAPYRRRGPARERSIRTAGQDERSGPQLVQSPAFEGVDGGSGCIYTIRHAHQQLRPSQTMQAVACHASRASRVDVDQTLAFSKKGEDVGG